MTTEQMYGSADRARLPGEGDKNYNAYLAGRKQMRINLDKEAAAKAAAPPPALPQSEERTIDPWVRQGGQYYPTIEDYFSQSFGPSGSMHPATTDPRAAYTPSFNYPQYPFPETAQGPYEFSPGGGGYDPMGGTSASFGGDPFATGGAYGGSPFDSVPPGSGQYDTRNLDFAGQVNREGLRGAGENVAGGGQTPASAGQQYGYDEFGRPYSSATATQGGGQMAGQGYGEPGTKYNVLSAPGVEALAGQYDPQVVNAMLVSLLGGVEGARIGNVRAMGNGLNVEVITPGTGIDGQPVVKNYTLDAAALTGNSPYQASQAAIQARSLEVQKENAELDRQTEMDVAGINQQIATLQMQSQERMAAGDNRTAMAIQKQIGEAEEARKGIEDDKFNRQMDFEKEAEQNRQTLKVMELQESMAQTGVSQTQADTAGRSVNVEEEWRRAADETERYIANAQTAIATQRDAREFEYQTWRVSAEAQVAEAQVAYQALRIEMDKEIAAGAVSAAANLQEQADRQQEAQRQLEQRLHTRELDFQKEQLSFEQRTQEVANAAIIRQMNTQSAMLTMQQDQQAFEQARALMGEGYEGRRVGLEEEVGRGGLATDQQRADLEAELGRGGLGVQQGQLGLEGELGRGQLGVQQGQLSVEQFLAALQGELGRGQLGIEQQRVGLEGELGRGQLGVEQGRLGLEGELGRGQLSLAQQQQLTDLMTTLSGQDIEREGMRGGLGVEQGRLGLEQELGRGQLGIEQGRFGLEQQQQAMDFARNPMTAAAWWNVSGGGGGGGGGGGQGAFAQGAQSGGLQQLGQGGGAPAQGGGGGFPIPQALDQALAGGGGSGLQTGGVPEGLIRLLSPQQLARLQPSQTQLYQALAQMQGVPLEDFMQMLSERGPSQREAQLRVA